MVTMTSNTPPTAARRRLYMSLRAKERALEKQAAVIRNQARKTWAPRQAILKEERDAIEADHVLTLTKVPTPQDNPFASRAPKYAAFCSCNKARSRYQYRMNAKEQRTNGGYLGEYAPHSRLDALMAHEGHLLTVASKNLGERDD